MPSINIARPREVNLSSEEQVPLRELLRDPTYRKWFALEPTFAREKWVTWRVYARVSRDKGWAKRDFVTWKAGFDFLAKNLGAIYDGALTCKNQPSRPPVVSVPAVKTVDGKKISYRKRQYYSAVLTYPGHLWCPYCRRPTVFGYFTTHHAFTGKFRPLPYKLRCGICGIARDAIKIYSAKEMSERA